MSFSDASTNLRRAAIYLSSISLVTLLGGTYVFAQNTTVAASICGSGAGASISITAPVSDSVINQPNVSVSGPVTNATQIDVSVDGQYNSTLPVNPQDTSYTTQVQLAGGTHTISLAANDVCQMQNATASVVVTYQQVDSPGPGSSTPTEVSDGGVFIGGQPLNDSEGSGNRLESWPIIGPLIRLGTGLAVGLDFEVGTPSGTLWRSVVRFSFIVIGISVMVFGNIAISAWGWTHCTTSLTKRWGLRCLGIVALILGFVI